MNTVKEFFNKLELEDRSIELEYNDMDIIIIKDSAVIAQVTLYDYDNDYEGIDRNIKLPFEYLTTIIMKFNNLSCIKESILHFASDNEIMKELINMQIINHKEGNWLPCMN